MYYFIIIYILTYKQFIREPLTSSLPGLDLANLINRVQF